VRDCGLEGAWRECVCVRCRGEARAMVGVALDKWRMKEDEASEVIVTSRLLGKGLILDIANDTPKFRLG